MSHSLSRLLLLAGAVLAFAGLPAFAQLTLVTDGTKSTTQCTSFTVASGTVSLTPTGCLGTALPPPAHPISVSKSGAGSGTVSSSPAGIDCGTTCSANFAAGTSVALTATASAGSFFGSWSGACAGTGACAVTADAAKAVTAEFSPNTTIPRLGNISTRMQVLSGSGVLIGGLTIGGSGPKTVVIRASGPSLSAAGIANPLANPVLQLFSGQNQIDSNDDWGTAPNAAAITASGFAPSNPLESAILVTLNPGAYTAIVTGAGAATGVGIVEVFEVDRPDVPLTNLSARGTVGTVNDVMIGGFIVQGAAAKTVVVRARGPSLAAAGVTGVLANPSLQLFSGANQVAANDNWGSAANVSDIVASGFAPSDPNESVIMMTLSPGAYTAIVTGVGGTVGVAIVEIFTLP